MRPIHVHPLSLLAGVLLLGTAGSLASMQSIAPHEAQGLSPEEREILSHMRLVQVGDARTLLIEGLNVQIVNGLGATNGYPDDPDSLDPSVTRVNGVGNLIVGYNERGNPSGDERSGSHNLVVGHGNSYSSFGGIVGPHDGITSDPFATVTGGTRNKASGAFASVSGGLSNVASGFRSWAAGGWGNTASGDYSSVSGGFGNIARGVLCSTVSGGRSNTAQCSATAPSTTTAAR